MQKEKLYDEMFEEPYLLSVNMMGVLNYSLVQSTLPLIDYVTFVNNTYETIEKGKIVIHFEFDFVESYEYEFDNLESGRRIELSPKLTIHARKLFELPEMIRDTVKIMIVKADDEVLVKEYKNYDVLPMNQWTGGKVFPQSLSAFVMPNIPQIIALQKRASQLLKEKTGNPSFRGYTSNDKNDVLNQMAAIYGAIYEQNISYALPPSDFTFIGQRVRTPKEVLEYKMGTCIEMAILYASVAESCGLHPFVVLTEGHAFVGVWLTELLFDEMFMCDYAEVSKRLSTGINDVEVLEATYMNDGHKKNFDQAVRSARGHLDSFEMFEGIIDIKRSHYLGIRPMPIVTMYNGEMSLIDYGLAEDADELAKNTRSVDEYFLDITQKEDVDKSKIWMRNLLDLSKRNALISFKFGPKSLQIFNSDLGQLEDALSNGEVFQIKEAFTEWEMNRKNVKIVDVESQKEVISQLSLAEFKGKRLRTFLPKEELEKTLKQLYREAKLSTEENGSSTLFLALGFLKWFDPGDVKDEDGNLPIRYAPLILLPIEIIRKSNQHYSIHLRDEDAQMNITILEMLRQKFSLNISGLSTLPEDESGVDIKLIFNSIRKAIMERKGWDVVEIAVIGTFSFSQFVMWDDINRRFDQLTENKVIQSLVTGRYTDYSTEILETKHLDNVVNLGELAIPMSIDSSQLLAVIEAAKGESFVLHGPPGTGKSQTITNMIANALYQGKTVLFVAEKIAALNVVSERLSKVGLGNFTLELHSNKTKKHTVLEKLGQNLELNPLEESKVFHRKIEEISPLPQQSKNL